MNGQIDQTGRLLTLELDGALSQSMFPVAFNGREALSELPIYIADIVSDNLSLAATDILGHTITVIVTTAWGTRRFEGIALRLSPGPLWGRGYRAYQLEIAPKLWLATLNARCRSFLNQSALDIVHQVLSDYGVTESKRGPGDVTRPVREFCLQYCESDYAFLSRLLEEEGLYFYFPLDHQNNSLVIVDGSNGSFTAEQTALKIGTHEMLAGWSHHLRTIPQGVTYSGYDFKQASVVTNAVQAANPMSFASAAKIETYPSTVMYEPRSQFFANLRMEQAEAQYETYQGKGKHPNFAPGGQFALDAKADAMAAGNNFLVAEAQHYATCYSHVSGEGGTPDYGNDFKALPATSTYRPPFKTERPRIYGPQTAVVDSDPDQYGRVKVKFHWGDGLDSWWARVAMPWAHNKMGFQFMPRTNSEVVVQFLEGNPEQPIIIGAVFNGVQQPLYTLPDNKTQSGVRGTDPDKTGAPETLNEWQFEDKAGSEFIKVFAQKDFNRVVVNDDTLEVRQGNRTVEIKQGNLSTTIDQGNETRELKMGALTTTLDQGDHTLELKMGNYSVKLDMGNQSTKLDLGSSTLEAMMSIELKVGENSLTIDQTGISLKGLMVQIEGTAMSTLKAPMTTVQGEGMVQITGGITMIG